MERRLWSSDRQIDLIQKSLLTLSVLGVISGVIIGQETSGDSLDVSGPCNLSQTVTIRIDNIYQSRSYFWNWSEELPTADCIFDPLEQNMMLTVTRMETPDYELSPQSLDDCQQRRSRVEVIDEDGQAVYCFSGSFSTRCYHDQGGGEGVSCEPIITSQDYTFLSPVYKFQGNLTRQGCQGIQRRTAAMTFSYRKLRVTMDSPESGFELLFIRFCNAWEESCLSWDGRECTPGQNDYIGRQANSTRIQNFHLFATKVTSHDSFQ